MALAVLLRVLQALILHPHPLVVSLTRKRLLEPVEKLRGRVRLVVVLAVGEHRQFVEIFGEPRSVLRDSDKTVLDQRRLRVQTHDLVGRRLVAGDAMAAIGDQLVDYLRAGGLVFDQHDLRIEQALLLAHRALERRIFEPPAQYAEQEEFFALHAPSCAHREIAELGRLVGGVPALHDAVETLRQFILAIALEPDRLDQAAAQRGGGLLILAGEVVFTDGPPDAVEDFERLAAEVQSLTLPAPKALRSPDGLDLVHLVSFGNRRKAENLPGLLREDVADGIVFLQPLHDHDDGTTALVVLPAVKSVIVPVVGGLSLRVGERLLRLQRIVDQDDVGTASGEHATGGGGEPVALAGGDEFLHRLAMRRQAGRKDPPIPRAHHDAAAVAGELVGEVLGIADAEDLGRGVMPQTPGRKGDRGHQGFQMTRWQVDDQPPDLAFPHGGQLGGDDLEMPVHRQLGLRIEVLETAHGEADEVLPQQDLVLGRSEVLEHHFSAFENRALSCSMTFSSASLKAEVSGEAGSVCPSISRTKSRRILIARQSAVAERLTSWVMIASRLVILRLPPLSLTITQTFSASLSSVFRFLAPGDRPRGLPDRPFVKRVWPGGLR